MDVFHGAGKRAISTTSVWLLKSSCTPCVRRGWTALPCQRATPWQKPAARTLAAGKISTHHLSSNFHPQIFEFVLFCRVKIELYEQSCAVDSVTKKCAGSPDRCRKAMLGILGTSLRSNCACKGTDFSQLYDCLGWQRLLWVNPCVGMYTHIFNLCDWIRLFLLFSIQGSIFLI